MWTDVRYTRSPRCCPCSPHSLYYLYSAWHQFRNALYWFCIANPSGDPFSFASWRVWAGRANTQTHLVQSVSVSDLLHTYKEQHTHTDTGQYVHCEKMYNMYMQTTLKKQEFPYTYIKVVPFLPISCSASPVFLESRAQAIRIREHD